MMYKNLVTLALTCTLSACLLVGCTDQPSAATQTPGTDSTPKPTETFTPENNESSPQDTPAETDSLSADKSSSPESPSESNTTTSPEIAMEKDCAQVVSITEDTVTLASGTLSEPDDGGVGYGFVPNGVEENIPAANILIINGSELGVGNVVLMNKTIDEQGTTWYELDVVPLS